MSNKYTERDSRNYIEDGEARALYWYCYRERFNSLKKELQIGKTIRADLDVCLVSNNLLKPQDFDLRKVDRSVIGSFVYPGVSAHIKFTNNLHEACGAIFDRDARRQDCMHIARVDLIERAGYETYYLPMPNQPLHVRLVHWEHLQNPELDQVPIRFRREIAEIFSAKKCRHN